MTSVLWAVDAALLDKESRHSRRLVSGCQLVESQLNLELLEHKYTLETTGTFGVVDLCQKTARFLRPLVVLVLLVDSVVLENLITVIKTPFCK